NGSTVQRFNGSTVQQFTERRSGKRFQHAANVAERLGQANQGVPGRLFIFVGEDAVILRGQQRDEDAARVDVAATLLDRDVLHRALDRLRVLDVHIIEQGRALADG